MGFLINGGWVMIALFLCSITAVAIIIQKAIILRQTVIEKDYVQNLKVKLSTDPVDVIIKELQFTRHTAGQIAAKSIELSDAPDETLAAEIQGVIKEDSNRLHSKMNVLSIIITVAPVLGLLGTVIGLMDVFSVIATEGVGKAELLSAGISKALITTVTGLSIAIPLMFIYQYLQAKIDQRLDEWDFIPQQLVVFCKQRR